VAGRGARPGVSCDYPKRGSEPMSQPIITAREGSLARGRAAVREANAKIRAQIMRITNLNGLLGG